MKDKIYHSNRTRICLIITLDIGKAIFQVFLVISYTVTQILPTVQTVYTKITTKNQ